MYSRTFLAVSLALLGGLTSCDDNSDIKPTPILSATDLLMAKSWKMTAVTEKEGSEPAKDLYTDEPACIRDNVYQFQTDGVFVMDEGATRCDQAHPQTRTGTWAQSNSGMLLKATIALSTQPGAEASMELSGTIESVSATRLVLVNKETTAGVTTETRTTFTAQ
ncbi:hypothetical protein MUN82_00800 [Hymenobacter aerilatus]|uniref:Lipocalin-like domain-containing protein n=1 Tax=Hymenobacter aerilatus TaxID=2932251 RepID=A0A8T9SY46_9BACT|nr:hypothetical protein [Hymenobacter aerilatus]UOR05653.1 hypothetical protein MUN82_00800 [Hymenobacter aerilatus]